MNIEEIKSKLEASLMKLQVEDAFLMEHDVSERALTHKLATYIAEEFSDFDVDCEYNSNVQNVRGKKYIYLLREKAYSLNLLRESDGDDEQVLRIVYPDVIVHKRGVNESNLLIVEVKKSSSRITFEYDYEKLTRYTSSDYDNELNYQFGVFIKLGVKENRGEFDTEWFENGEIAD